MSETPQVGQSTSSPPKCAYCGDVAPYGDARLPWLSHHDGRAHRAWWTIKAHARYAKYIVRHKWFVFVAGRKTGAPLWRLIIHDWSKLTPAEWGPYVRSFYGPQPRTAAVKRAFDAAWLHHQHRNPHHWQHWLLQEDDGDLKVLEMPPALVREMVADWAGAGRAITGGWDVAAWYEREKSKIELGFNTRGQVESLLTRHFA